MNLMRMHGLITAKGIYTQFIVKQVLISRSFVDQDGMEGIELTCDKASGCQLVERRGVYGDEQVAGPGCRLTNGYNGNTISVEEMKGCRAVQCIVKKPKDWKPESDDQDFELESGYFLTGFGEGSPDTEPLEIITPPRHGVMDILISNYEFDACSPFCFIPLEIMELLT